MDRSSRDCQQSDGSSRIRGLLTRWSSFFAQEKPPSFQGEAAQVVVLTSGLRGGIPAGRAAAWFMSSISWAACRRLHH